MSAAAPASTHRTLSVVFPVYMNEGSLPLLAVELGDFEHKLASLGLCAEVIFVDDGSTDSSFKELLKIKQNRPETKLVKLSRNFGAVAAAKAGMRYVTGDCFILVAADQQDPLDQVIEMAKYWLDGRKFVISARASRADARSERWFATLYYFLIKLLVTPNYPRGGFDLMLMDRTLLPYVAMGSRNVNPNMFAFWMGFEPKVLEYHRRARTHGKSRWTFRKKFTFFVDTITAFSVVPIRAITGIGVLTSVVSFAYGFYILVAAMGARINVSGFATIVVMTAFFFGLVLIMLGIIGEYLWRTFDIVSAKPESVIDETFL